MASDGQGRRRIYIDGQTSAPIRRPPLPAVTPGPMPPPNPVPVQAGPPPAAEAETAAVLEEELRQRLTLLSHASRRIADSIAADSTDELRKCDSEVAARQRSIVKEKDSAVAAKREAFAQRRHAAYRAVEFAVADVAPGWASADWADAWFQLPTRPASHVRFGATQCGPAAIAPFLEHAGWALRGADEESLGLIRQVILRVVAQVPLRFLRIRVFDPRVEGALGSFSVIRDASPASYPPPAHSAEELRGILNELTELSSKAGEDISARNVRSLGELWIDEGRPIHPYAVLVILAYPLGIDEATQSALVRLAQSGAARGVSLLVQIDSTVKPPRDVDPEELLRHLTPFEAHDGTWRTSLLPAGVTVSADPAPGPEVVKEVLSRAISQVGTDTGPTVPLADLLAGFAQEPWRDTVEDGIDAVIGLRGREPVTLSLRSENPPHPNLLIGGAVGQGKSNLLLTIIYALAVRYGPDQLEMLLLDFKQGLEFKRFDKDASGRNWLPHARVLSLESSKSFGLAVLEFVQQEMQRRAHLFNAARCNGFAEYRRNTGEPMTRMLLIIDEFHVLFDGNDDVTAAAVLLFEQLARQGRAFGIHILLSSQTLSGISGLQVKGDSIFAQFPLRVSLKNTPEESQAILSRGNTAAADLSYRGEIVVNRNYGMTGSNETAVAGYADPAWISGLQNSLWERVVAPREPWLFLGNHLAPWPNRLPEADSPTAIIGRPIAVSDEVVQVQFANDVDQALALIGTGDGEAAAVLGACIASLTAGLGPDGQLIVLDGRPAGQGDPVLGTALARARSEGIDVNQVRGEEVPDFLINDLAARLQQAGPATVVLAIHLQRIAKMAEDIPIDPESDYGPTISGASVLRDLTMQGSAAGIHVIGWWPSLRALAGHLSFDHGGVSRYVFLRVGLDDLRQVAGPHVQPAEGSPRVQFFDRASDEGIRVVVPFEPPVGSVR